jgi:hypothetical protein
MTAVSLLLSPHIKAQSLVLVHSEVVLKPFRNCPYKFRTHALDENMGVQLPTSNDPHGLLLKCNPQ